MPADRLAGARREAEASMRPELDLEPRLPAGPVASVLAVRADGDDLAFDLDTAPVRAMGGQASAAFTDWPGFAKVQSFGNVAGDFGQLLHRRFDLPDASVEQTHVIVNPVQAQVAREREGADSSTSVLFMQSALGDDPETVASLRVQVLDDATGASRVDLDLKAPSFAAMRRDHPDEVRRWLGPVFADLGASAVLGAGGREAWQVLAADAPADAAVGRRVDAVLAGLDADDFAGREAARAELSELGEPAAVELMRRERAGTAEYASAEQRGAVKAFLAEYRPLPADRADALRDDPTFLLDAMLAEDAALRGIAADRLRAVTGTPFEFDPSAEGDALRASVDRARAVVAGGGGD